MPNYRFKDFPVMFWSEPTFRLPAGVKTVNPDDLPYRHLMPPIVNSGSAEHTAMFDGAVSAYRLADSDRCTLAAQLGANVIMDSIDTIDMAKDAGIKLMAHSYWFPDDPSADEIKCHLAAPTVGDWSTLTPGTFIFWNTDYLEWMCDRYADDDALIGFNISASCVYHPLMSIPFKWMRDNHPELIAWASNASVTHDFSQCPIWGKGFWTFGPKDRPSARKRELVLSLYRGARNVVKHNGIFWAVLPVRSSDYIISRSQISFELFMSLACGAQGIIAFPFNVNYDAFQPGREAYDVLAKFGPYIRDHVGPAILGRDVVDISYLPMYAGKLGIANQATQNNELMIGFLAPRGSSTPDMAIAVDNRAYDGDTLPAINYTSVLKCPYTVVDLDGSETTELLLEGGEGRLLKLQ